ncbi:hypothetical protein ACFFK0_21455 [Paenibacillus chartarius]|uniref:DUF3813 domain-containing protein n=1 Tax=Paenibacillus chartarius TaxID=747481 RepID=A0ABV6DQN7_9BACL
MADANREQQALNSVEKALNATGQVGDNPSEQLVEQANNSLIHANVAVGQALQSGEPSEALRSAQEQLQEAESELNG